MHITDFHTLFSGVIRAQISWQRLLDAEPRVDTVVTAERDFLGQLRTIWYRDPDGGPGDWERPDHEALTVAEAAYSPESWTREKGDKIEGLCRHFQKSSEPNQLLLPCYRVEDEYLLLDASHRSVAAFRAGGEIRALILAVAGPIDHAILADLDRPVHALNQCSRSSGADRR